jgi:hypothetical protein
MTGKADTAVSPLAAGRRFECRVAEGHAESQLLQISVPPEIIHQAIWLYLRFTLSFRDVEDCSRSAGLNVALLPTRGNHLDLRRLSGGAEGIRTDGHRGLAASNRGIFILNFKGAYEQNASANHLSLFARKPQIPLASGPQESNGRGVLRIDPPTG